MKGESLKFHQVFPLQELGLLPLVNYSLCFGIASTNSATCEMFYISDNL